MSFSSPVWLLSLLAVPALLLFFFALLNRRRARAAITYTNLDLLAHVVTVRSSWRRWVPLTLFVLALATAAAASKSTPMSSCWSTSPAR
jgi:hypothetical protein